MRKFLNWLVCKRRSHFWDYEDNIFIEDNILMVDSQRVCRRCGKKQQMTNSSGKWKTR